MLKQIVIQNFNSTNSNANFDTNDDFENDDFDMNFEIKKKMQKRDRIKIATKKFYKKMLN